MTRPSSRKRVSNQLLVWNEELYQSKKRATVPAKAPIKQESVSEEDDPSLEQDDESTPRVKEEPGVKEEEEWIPDNSASLPASLPVVPATVTIKKEEDEENETGGDLVDPTTNSTADLPDVEANLSSSQVKQEEAKQKLREAKKCVMEIYRDRLLLRRFDGIGALGGSHQGTDVVPAFKNRFIWDEDGIVRPEYPIPKSLQGVDLNNYDDPDIMEHFAIVAANDLWQVNGPKFAGQPTAAIDCIPNFSNDLGATFPLFMKRTKTTKHSKAPGALLGWEYVGNFKYIGDKDLVVWESSFNFTNVMKKEIAGKVYKSSQAQGDSYGKHTLQRWRNILMAALHEDPSPAGPLYMIEQRDPTSEEKKAPRASLAARARALGMEDATISDQNLANILVQLDEFHQQHVIQFVEYDERIYEYCSQQPNGSYDTTAGAWDDFAMQHGLL
jgi:hypothetical protein